MILSKAVQYFSGLLICIIFALQQPIETTAKTFKTDHWVFSAGFMWQYNEDEKETLNHLVMNLDNIWQHVNTICDNELPQKLKMSVHREGTLSMARRKEKKILINSLKIKTGIRDSLTIVAHETTHIGYYKISNGKISDGENEFLDEGIASYAMYAYEPKAAEKRALSLAVAKTDLENGGASLNYLRNWQKNVNDRLFAFSKNWRKKHPGKYSTLEEELKVGVNSYFTAMVFVEYLIDVYGLQKFVQAIKNIGDGDSQSMAFQKAMGKSIEDIFTEWHDFLGSIKLERAAIHGWP